MPTPADVFRGRPPAALTARPTADSRPVPTADRPSADAPFTVRYRAAVMASALNVKAKRIALVLADRADPQTGVIPLHVQVGTRALATLTGMGQAGARTAVGALQSGGWIYRTAPETPGAVACIRLLMPSPSPPR